MSTETQPAAPEPQAEERRPTRLYSLGTVLQEALPEGKQWDTQYDWTPRALSEMLLDLDEEVFIFHGLRGGPVHMVTFEIATKLKAFLQDFAI